MESCRLLVMVVVVGWVGPPLGVAFHAVPDVAVRFRVVEVKYLAVIVLFVRSFLCGLLILVAGSFDEFLDRLGSCASFFCCCPDH